MIKLRFEKHPSAFLAENQGFQVTEITHVFGNPNWVFSFHTHEKLAEIIYIAQGRGIFTINGSTFHAVKGDMLLVNPNAVHSLVSDPHDALDVWTLNMQGVQLGNMLPGHIISTATYPHFASGDAGGAIHLLLEQILDAYTNENTEEHTHDLRHMLGLSLLLMVHRKVEQKGDRLRLAKPETTYSEIALEVLHYIDQNYRKAITIDQLARQFHVSASHLAHLFATEFGISPINYQISRRMSEAQWLLIGTTHSVSSIAYQVGYDNAYYFTKLFKKRIGIHPQGYRERYTSYKADKDSLFA